MRPIEPLRSILLTAALSAALGLSLPAWAADGFDRIWKATLEHSPGLKAEVADQQAAETASSRSARHWLPRLNLGLGAVSTNSPSTVLFSTLGSASLQASDLQPALLNDPRRQTFRNGNLTLDLPLFEGGARSSASRGQELMQESRRIATRAKREELFTDLVRDYAVLLALKDERTNLEQLKAKLGSVIAGYRLGARENPVGYSGLLGMRALRNRIESALSMNLTEFETTIEALRIRSALADLGAGDIAGEGAVTFARIKLGVAGPASTPPLRVASQQLAARAQGEFAQAERARWLPRVGVFASAGVVAGERDSNAATEYGAYLQWQLFDGTQLGAYREASLRAQASSARVEEMNEAMRQGRLATEKTLPVLLENLTRVEESAALTVEQTQTTERLFGSGAVNALQFSEVLSRRADVIQSKRELERAVLAAMVNRYLMNRGENE